MKIKKDAYSSWSDFPLTDNNINNKSHCQCVSGFYLQLPRTTDRLEVLLLPFHRLRDGSGLPHIQVSPSSSSNVKFC